MIEWGRAGVVNVRITVERMDIPGAAGGRVDIMLPLPDDLLRRKRDVKLMTKVAGQVLEAFAKAYMKVCD